MMLMEVICIFALRGEHSINYASGNANGQAIVTKANLEVLMTQEKKLLVTCDNNPLTLTIK